FATIVPSSRHVTDPSLPMASLGCGGALIRAHTGPVLRYRFVTFGVRWNRGSTCFMSLLRILGIKISCWFATGLQARNRAGDRRGCRLGRLCARQIRQPPRATAPAAQGNYASRRRTGRVRILLSLESIRTRPQLEEDTSKRTRPASASGESPQHSTTLTARPPSAVSLYFEDISAPVWRIE